MAEDSGSGSNKPGQRRRTKTGCITCRIRRVKCDESRPSCNRCTQSKRVCDGYLSEPPAAAAAAVAETALAGPHGHTHPLSDRRRLGALALASAGSGPAATAYRKPLSRRALALALRQVQAVGPAARVLTPSPYLETDVACFDFFRLRLTAVPADPKQAQRTTHGGQSAHNNFWNYTLLQVAHAEPAVWHAVAALGALYRQWEVISGSYVGQAFLDASAADDDLSPVVVTTLTPATAQTSSSKEGAATAASTAHDRNVQSSRLAAQAAACYACALRLAQSIRDPTAMLVLSVSLAAAANVAGKWKDRSVHFRGAQNIMAHLLRQSRDGKLTSAAQLHAADSLAKLGLHWLTFIEETAPPPRGPEGFSLSSVAGSARSGAGGGGGAGAGGRVDGGQWDLQRANIEMVGIFGRIMALARTEDLHEGPLVASAEDQYYPPADTAQSAETVLRDLAQWEEDMAVLLERSDGGDGDGGTSCSSCSSSSSPPSPPTSLYTTNALDILGLKLLHTCTRLAIAVNAMMPRFNELAWDACLGYFERIVALVVLILRTEAQTSPLMQSVMSLNEPAINMVLWLVTHRCRHPIVRRRALRLLSSIRRTEGAWMSTTTAIAAGKIVAVEERGLSMSRGVVKTDEESDAAADDMSTTAQKKKKKKDRNKQQQQQSFRGGWAAVERALIREIQAENNAADARSWLGPDAAWQRASKIGWDVPAEVVVPLHKRVLQVDIRVEYSPCIGESKGLLILRFADESMPEGIRVEEVTIMF